MSLPSAATLPDRCGEAETITPERLFSSPAHPFTLFFHFSSFYLL
jgi:hypothetical protein